MSVLRSGLVSSLLILLAVACGNSDGDGTLTSAGGGSNSSGGFTSNTPGVEGGPCYPNATCNAGFVCTASRCAAADPVIGGGGISGSGGSGGAVGTGGSNTAGGSGRTGTGGSTNTGGRGGSTGGSVSDASADAAGFCGGTSVAGTCLATFFAPASVCFRPSGACVSQTASTTKNVCWAGGEKLLLQSGGQGFTYENGGQLCFYGSWEYMNGTEKDYTFTADGNALLVYNRSTGETVCADGSHTTLPPGFGGCVAILSLVDIDVSGCTPGGCSP